MHWFLLDTCRPQNSKVLPHMVGLFYVTLYVKFTCRLCFSLVVQPERVKHGKTWLGKAMKLLYRLVFHTFLQKQNVSSTLLEPCIQCYVDFCCIMLADLAVFSLQAKQDMTTTGTCPFIYPLKGWVKGYDTTRPNKWLLFVVCHYQQASLPVFYTS